VKGQRHPHRTPPQRVGNGEHEHEHSRIARKKSSMSNGEAKLNATRIISCHVM